MNLLTFFQDSDLALGNPVSYKDACGPDLKTSPPPLHSNPAFLSPFIPTLCMYKAAESKWNRNITEHFSTPRPQTHTQLQVQLKFTQSSSPNFIYIEQGGGVGKSKRRWGPQKSIYTAKGRNTSRDLQPLTTWPQN